jgi:hypothetical protein
MQQHHAMKSKCFKLIDLRIQNGQSFLIIIGALALTCMVVALHLPAQVFSIHMA